MRFDSSVYQVEEGVLEENGIERRGTYRAFRNRIYVEHPVLPEYQQMHIFAPEVYFHGGGINGYDVKTAPVFVPNTVGGYMPGPLIEPDRTILRALEHGYVVALPAIRGRVQQNRQGEYIGKAPACIVDYKAAVRYLHYFAKELPGDMSKIITNGTSAGGALSALMGATGNHLDYEPYLERIGAAKAGDNVFAASCYCPITNLDHADMAYEWEFGCTYDRADENSGVREHITISDELKESFIKYVNGLNLRSDCVNQNTTEQYRRGLCCKERANHCLTLNKDGTGSFLAYMKGVVLASAQRAIDRGEDVSEEKWLTVIGGRAVDMDWEGYVCAITRMKPAPAFDYLNMTCWENDLFGTAKESCRHFTQYGYEHSRAEKPLMAEPQIVRMMNPMNYIGDDMAQTAMHWRIRHGECDRDTSLAISAILTLVLRKAGCEVDYHAPWKVPHAGDYDLEELFAWIDSIC